MSRAFHSPCILSLNALDSNWEKLAKCKVAAPWKPFIRPPPKGGRTGMSITQGAAYDATNDPFPGFTFKSNCGQSNRSDDTLSRFKPSRHGFSDLFSSKSSKQPRTNITSCLRRPFRRAAPCQIPPPVWPNSSGIKKIVVVSCATTAVDDANRQVKAVSANTVNIVQETSQKVKWCVRKMWIPKVKNQKGRQVDLLA